MQRKRQTQDPSRSPRPHEKSVPVMGGGEQPRDQAAPGAGLANAPKPSGKAKQFAPNRRRDKEIFCQTLWLGPQVAPEQLADLFFQRREPRAQTDLYRLSSILVHAATGYAPNDPKRLRLYKGWRQKWREFRQWLQTLDEQVLRPVFIAYDEETPKESRRSSWIPLPHPLGY